MGCTGRGPSEWRLVPIELSTAGERQAEAHELTAEQVEAAMDAFSITDWRQHMPAAQVRFRELMAAALRAARAAGYGGGERGNTTRDTLLQCLRNLEAYGGDDEARRAGDRVILELIYGCGMPAAEIVARRARWRAEHAECHVPRDPPEPRDGLTSRDEVYWPTVESRDPSTGTTYYNVDRRLRHSPELPPLEVEISAWHMWDTLSPCYCGMYEWDHYGRWCLRPEYVEEWGRRT